MYGVSFAMANFDGLRELMTSRGILPQGQGGGNQAGGNQASIFDQIIGCQGEPPDMPDGSNVEYAEGARGPTPNATGFQVQQMELQFNGLIVSNGSAVKWYRSEGDIQILRAITEFSNRYAGPVVADYPISMKMFILNEDNDPDNPMLAQGGDLIQSLYHSVYEISRIRFRRLSVNRMTTTLTVDALTYAREFGVGYYPGTEQGSATNGGNGNGGLGGTNQV